MFGTVIGVVQAFAALGEAAKTPVAQATSQALAPQRVMSSIAEALVATAVGLAVAIPAVAANNTFQRMIRTKLANTDALTRILLAHIKAVDPVEDAPDPDEMPRKLEKVDRATRGAKNGQGHGSAQRKRVREPASASAKGRTDDAADVHEDEPEENEERG